MNYLLKKKSFNNFAIYEENKNNLKKGNAYFL